MEHLLSAFVFAVSDQQARELFLARDPLGEYSLSYWQSRNRFVFASENTAILELRLVNPGLSEGPWHGFQPA